MQHREYLGSEGLVQLDKVDVTPSVSRLGKQLVDCRHRPDPHVGRMHPRRRPTPQVSHRLQAQLIKLVSAATTKHTDAASFCELELPAVTEPSFINGLSLPSDSMEVSLRGPSSDFEHHWRGPDAAARAPGRSRP